MKGIIEFDLSIPEEDEKFKFLVKALDFYLAIYDFDMWLRSRVKYNGDETFRAIREHLKEYLEGRDCSLEMLS